LAQINEKKKGREREKKEGRKEGRKEGAILVPWNNLAYTTVTCIYLFCILGFELRASHYQGRCSTA
jgi:hypothetical protein